MKKGFTIVEVSILLVIFCIVAFLVAPLSVDDTMQARNTYRWKNVQQDFTNIFDSIRTNQESQQDFTSSLVEAMNSDIEKDITPYKITFLNGSSAQDEYYKFQKFQQTKAKAVVSTKIFDTPQNDVYGLIMYDVNGKKGPNTWGKDVFGYNIKQNNLEPFCQKDFFPLQKNDCSKRGTGICCSNYYLIGGSFD